MTKIPVGTTLGRVEVKVNDNGAGVIDDAAVTAFTHGECHSFAVALHDRTGWPIIGIGYATNTPAHFVVYDPTIDDYVDIQGPGALDRWEYLAKQMIREFDRNEVVAPPKYYKGCSPKLAEPFVTTVLEELPTSPVSDHPNAAKYLTPKLRDEPMW